MEDKFYGKSFGEVQETIKSMATPSTTEEWEEELYNKYEDKGDDRYGHVKHNNTVLQNLLNDFSRVLISREAAVRREERERAVEIAEKLAHKDIHKSANWGMESKEEVVHLFNLITNLRAGTEV